MDQKTYLYIIRNAVTKKMEAMRTFIPLKINQMIRYGDCSSLWEVIGEIVETTL